MATHSLAIVSSRSVCRQVMAYGRFLRVQGLLKAHFPLFNGKFALLGRELDSKPPS